MAWKDLTASDIAADLGAAYTLFEDLKNNDEALVDRPFTVNFVEKSGSTTHPTFSGDKYTMRVTVPDAATTLRVTLEGKVASGTGYVRGVLSATNSDTDPTFTNTSYSATPPDSSAEVTLVWSDISSLRNTEVDLKFQVSNSGGANTFIRSLDRATARWGAD